MTSSHQRLRSLAGPALLVLAFAILTFISWRRWTDPVVDFGRELYTAWQLAEGKTLYGEVEHLYGPLSACCNAALFRLLGSSYTVLAVANLTLLAGFTALLYRVWRELTDNWTAVCVGLGFLCVSAFAMYRTDISNFNFITPYSHELVHGTYLSVLALSVLNAHAQTPRLRRAAFAGLLYGLVFLTKSEVFLALTFAIAAYVGAELLAHRISPRALLVLGSCLAAGVLVSVIGLYLVAGMQLSVPVYLRGVTRQYLLGLNPGVSHNPFYRHLLGLDHPLAHALDALRAGATVGLVLLVFAGLGRWHQSAWSQRQRGGPWLATAAGLAVACAMVRWDWHYLACVLPVVLGMALLAELLKSRRAGWVLWLGFALGMLIKSGLNPLFIHYGFCLSAAGLMCVLALLLFHLPSLYAIPLRPTMRLWMTVWVAVGVLRLAGESVGFYADRQYVVGIHPRDQFRVLPPDQDLRGQIINDAAAWLTAHAPASATLAVVPEGVMLNYLTRRVNPTPFITLIAIELAAYGEPHMLAAYQARPPDYIVFIDRDLSEFGLPRFGTPGYPGADFMRWVKEQYVAVHDLAAPSLASIYQHRAPGAGVP